MTINCVITDDEPFAINGLKAYIEKIDFLSLVGTCENVFELNSCILKNKVDLLFLDIEMPLITGIEYVKSLAQRPMVIFTTAYEKYALEGYELDVVDYLIKPISFERFLKASNKALQYFQLLNGKVRSQDYFFIKCGYRLEKIMINEILFIESLQNYINIYTEQNKFTTHYTLKAIKEYLTEKKFIQTHQSYILSVDKIEAIEGNQVIVKQYKIPISKYLKEKVLKSIVNSSLIRK